jgi:hypothetical protein
LFDNNLQGVFSERDYLKKIALKGKRSFNVRVREVSLCLAALLKMLPSCA